MSTIKTLYNLLQINRKIEDRSIRMLYLHEVWGMEQKVIGELEEFSQSFVSKNIKLARTTLPDSILREKMNIIFTAEEIKFIQFLPREVISDLQVIAFIKDLLDIEVLHPFFTFYNYAENMRIAALGSLGVQNKRIQQLFGKSQSAVSMIIKRGANKLPVERQQRYDQTSMYSLSPQRHNKPFLKAGGN